LCIDEPQHLPHQREEKNPETLVTEILEAAVAEASGRQT
jgi:hypothetical protein